MTTDEINAFINKLASDSNKDNAYFGLDDTDYDNPVIRANKKGLQLMAIEFLYASMIETETGTWGIREDWIKTSNMEFIQIEIVRDKTDTVAFKNDPSKLTQRLVEIGCGVGAILALCLLAIGAVSVIKTLLSWL